MVRKGVVTESYIQDVYAREAMGLTCLLDADEKGIAIVHTVTSKEVNPRWREHCTNCSANLLGCDRCGFYHRDGIDGSRESHSISCESGDCTK